MRKVIVVKDTLYPIGYIKFDRIDAKPKRT